MIVAVLAVLVLVRLGVLQLSPPPPPHLYAVYNGTLHIWSNYPFSVDGGRNTTRAALRAENGSSFVIKWGGRVFTLRVLYAVRYLYVDDSAWRAEVRNMGDVPLVLNGVVVRPNSTAVISGRGEPPPGLPPPKLVLKASHAVQRCDASACSVRLKVWFEGAEEARVSATVAGRVVKTPWEGGVSVPYGGVLEVGSRYGTYSAEVKPRLELQPAGRSVKCGAYSCVYLQSFAAKSEVPFTAVLKPYDIRFEVTGEAEVTLELEPGRHVIIVVPTGQRIELDLPAPPEALTAEHEGYLYSSRVVCAYLRFENPSFRLLKYGVSCTGCISPDFKIDANAGEISVPPLSSRVYAYCFQTAASLLLSNGTALRLTAPPPPKPVVLNYTAVEEVKRGASVASFRADIAVAVRYTVLMSPDNVVWSAVLTARDVEQRPVSCAGSLCVFTLYRYIELKDSPEARRYFELAGARLEAQNGTLRVWLPNCVEALGHIHCFK